MANIKKIENKDGLSFKITVSSGRDASGKQIRHFKTYTPPSTWSEQRAAKEAAKQAMVFEESIEKGYELDNRQTFAEYAQYVLELKIRQNRLKSSTYERYLELLKRINPIIGHIKLSDIRPAHLNSFYIQLAREGSRTGTEKATSKANLADIIKKQKLSRIKLAEKSGVSASTVNAASKGETISGDFARKIADTLSYSADKLFSFERNMKPLSDKTIVEHHRLISAVLAQAEKEMLVPYNAAAKSSPPQVRRPEPNYFQPDTVYDILEAAKSESLKYRTFINMLVVTGCRRGEIAGLKWTKIDFNTGKILIDCGLYYSPKRGIYEGTTKTNERRAVKIPMEIIAMLKTLRAEQTQDKFNSDDRWTETGYVFTKSDGTPVNPDTWTAWLGDFSKHHGLPHINPHAFRHTVASVLISNGVDVLTTSKLLGHASVTTTESFYAHMIEDAKDAASDTLTEVLLKRKA